VYSEVVTTAPFAGSVTSSVGGTGAVAVAAVVVVVVAAVVEGEGAVVGVVTGAGGTVLVAPEATVDTLGSVVDDVHPTV
jgi:hypothetical protein